MFPDSHSIERRSFSLFFKDIALWPRRIWVLPQFIDVSLNLPGIGFIKALHVFLSLKRYRYFGCHKTASLQSFLYFCFLAFSPIRSSRLNAVSAWLPASSPLLPPAFYLPRPAKAAAFREPGPPPWPDRRSGARQAAPACARMIEPASQPMAWRAWL